MRVLSGRSIPLHLSTLVLLSVLPMWVAGGSLLFYAYQTKRALVEEHMLETARMLRQSVEREMAATLGGMQMLAGSRRLASGDLAGFERRARDLLASRPGADIILADEAGQQLVNTHENFGTPLPRRNAPEAVAHIFTTATPFVSGVFQGRVTGRPLVSIDMPVWRDGRVLYDLAITLPTETIASLLHQEFLPEGSIIAVFDGSRKLIARSRGHEELVGHFASPEQKEVAGLAEGIYEAISLEGEPCIFSFSRSATLSWSVVVGTPKALVAAELRRWLLWMTGGGVAISLLVLGVAAAIARRMARSVSALAAAAATLGDGGLVHARRLAVSELTAVQRALALASRQLRRQQSRLLAAKNEAELATVGKSKFMAAVSHDLRQPLQAMAMFLSVLEARDGQADAALRAKLARCHASLSEMLADMLDLNKLDAGVIMPRPAAFAVDTLLEQVAAPQEALARAKGLSLRRVSTKAAVYGDYGLMRSILLNLVSNAIRYTEAGGIVVGCRRRQGRRWIEVWDTGIGIPKEEFEAIFQEFEQLGNPERSREKGSGLGLAIVRKTADLLGLEVTVRSIPGKGSVFAIELPAPAPGLAPSPPAAVREAVPAV